MWDTVKDIALFLLSVGLWLMAAWMAFNGILIANFGEGDFWLTVGALVPAAAGWWVWPGEEKSPPKTDPWSL